MRKVWMAAIAAVVVSRSRPSASRMPSIPTKWISHPVVPGNKAGSLAKPLPAFLNFGYEVGDTKGNRPSVINQYFIASEGVKYFPKARPTCTFSQADESPKYNNKCKPAIVGNGSIANAFGAATDPTREGRL